MWRPNEPVVEDISDLRGNDLQKNAGDHAAARGVTGLLTKPSLGLSNMFALTEHSSVPSVLILDQRSSLRSFID